MVQVIENRADVRGWVRRARPALDRQDCLTVDLEIEKVRPVEGYANLFEGAVGTTLPVLVPARFGHRLAGGGPVRVEARIRRATPTAVFVVPRSLRIRTGEAIGDPGTPDRTLPAD